MPIAEIAGPVRIYPLNHMPVIKDLVVDLTHLYAQYRLIEPWLQAKPRRRRNGNARNRSPNGPTIDGLWECILCFCCTGGCPSWWWNGDRYLGPAVLLQAYRWIVDSRDEATGRTARPAGGSVPPVSLPHDHELHAHLPEMSLSRKGDCTDQEGDRGAADVTIGSGCSAMQV